MGLLETLSGGQTETEQKYAILLSAGPDDAPVANNTSNYALEFADAGYEVKMFLDGQAKKWSGAFDATAACKNSGIELLTIG